MDELSQVNRPVTLGEIASVAGIPARRLERLLARHSIRPACLIGRTRLYGPRQVRQASDALGVVVLAEVD